MRLNTLAFLTGTMLATFSAAAIADDKADLIAQDMAWGTAGMKGDTNAAAKLLSEDLISVTDTGVRGKKAELADNTPAPAGEVYEPSDYQVLFLNADTAIMTHGTKGTDAHTSLHVWSRKNGTWQVLATSTTPLKKK